MRVCKCDADLKWWGKIVESLPTGGQTPEPPTENPVTQPPAYKASTVEESDYYVLYTIGYFRYGY